MLTIRKQRCAGCAALTLLALTLGCGNTRELGEVRGIVRYNGKPLEFGSVMFQPSAGRPAVAQIQSDGTFVLSTPTEGDGAPVGQNQVRVTCYEIQKPGASVSDAEENAFGKSLIPEKYASYATSGITVDVKPGDNELIEINLTDNASGN
ncbi:MAG: hypothetical protein KDA42_12730 [Planctomycetales bacterium]|nr:hypothetical protein [Planctomycetales bacterium]